MQKNDTEKNIFASTTDSFLRNISWIFMILGLGLILLATKLDVIYGEIASKVGFTILTSGVFAAIMKSFQFIGIFKQEIENVILESKFIEKRNDLPDLWKKISQCIYKQKFPEISNELQQIILSAYFPTNHEYYYEDAVISINIESLDENEVIKYTQTSKFKVVLSEKVDSITMKQYYSLDKSENVKNCKCDRIYYKIDGEDKLDSMAVETTETEFEINRISTLKISGKRTFMLEYKEAREICIKDDNIKLFRMTNITKEMDVNISYPDNLFVSFFNVGVVQNFELKHLDSKNTISRVHKNGLILPFQGFGLSYVRK